jgi:hypothetical protein
MENIQIIELEGDIENLELRELSPEDEREIHLIELFEAGQL